MRLALQGSLVFAVIVGVVLVSHKPTVGESCTYQTCAQVINMDPYSFRGERRPGHHPIGVNVILRIAECPLSAELDPR